MIHNAENEEFVGSRGTPPPNDPIFSGRVVIDAGNKVPSSFVGKPLPTKNAPDNKEFREKLKAYLAEKWGVDDAKFDEIQDKEWKIIKQVENNIYHFGGLVDDNVQACACHLGFYKCNAIKK